MSSLNLQISATADDGYRESGFFSTAFCYAGYWGAVGDIFLRFNNVTIPQGSIITSAAFKFRTYDENVIGSTFKSKVAFNNVDNAVSPVNEATFNSYMANLTSSVTADYAASEIAQNTNYTYKADLSKPLQEIIDRSGWASGNSLLMFFMDNGSTGPNNYININDYSVSPTNSAKLEITYELKDGLVNNAGNVEIWANGGLIEEYTSTSGGQTEIYKDSTSGDFIIKVKGDEMLRLSD